MVFFVGNDGMVINSVPSPVYQGSAGANDIYVVAPFAANLSATVAFKLPNGVYTERFPMKLVNELAGIVDKQTGQAYNGWQFSMPNSITEYYGTVMAQFFFYSAQGVMVATSSTSFPVERGVPQILPATPTADVYDLILENLSSIQSDLKNGYFTARAIYAWNSAYSYGANELVFYPDKGEYGVFVKSLVDNNANPPYTNNALNAEYWEEITDFNVLNDLYSLKTDVEQAVESAQSSADSAAESATTATAGAEAAEQSASNAENAAQRAENAASSLESVLNGETAVPKAIGDENGVNIAQHFETIESYISSGTSEDNQLTNKNFVNSSINNMAAFYITSNAGGDAFPSRADLLNATTFYSGGQERVPTQNDYAYVLSDESQPKDSLGNYPTTRYSYQGGTYPDGQWDFQYVVNNTSLTQAQVDAINSGITKDIVDTIGKGNVVSVNGQTGEVSVTPANIGALPTSASVDGVAFDDTTDIDHYATCGTMPNVAAKIVNKTGFLLKTGARITVYFSQANITNSPTLNVNNTGAKTIKADGDTTYVKWNMGAVMDFVYDGTYWVCMAGYPLQGMRVGALYFSNNSTSPATLYGGSWTAINNPISNAQLLKNDVAYTNVSAGNERVLTSITVPANCIAIINGYVQANAADSSAIMNAQLSSTIGIDQNVRTTLNSGGGASVTTVVAPQAEPYTVQLKTYNYRNMVTPLGGFLEVLYFPIGYAWRRTA